MPTQPGSDPHLAELDALSRQHQKDLPPEFFTDLVTVASDLTGPPKPGIVQERSVAASLGDASTDSGAGWSSRLRAAILAELYLLLCTNAPNYNDVRQAGQALAQPGVTAVAGVVGAAFVGVPIGLITGAVAFLLLLVAKVGVNSLCRAYSDTPLAPQPTERPAGA